MRKFGLALAVLALMVCGTLAFAAALTGSWSGAILSNGESMPAYFVLKQDGAALTGTGGPDTTEQLPMQNGKVDGDKFSFDVPAGKGTFHFELTQEGDTLKGTFQLKSEQNQREGTISMKRVS